MLDDRRGRYADVLRASRPHARANDVFWMLNKGGAAGGASALPSDESWFIALRTCLFWSRRARPTCAAAAAESREADAAGRRRARLAKRL